MTIAKALLLGLALSALSLPALAQARADSVEVGAATYRARCAVCHSSTANTNGVGPTLFGVVGRPIASVQGYNYSRALAAGTGAWSPEVLNAFLQNPARAYPGTRMTVAVPDEAQRRAVIAYMATLR